jgi:hypothetical protein
MKITMTIYPSHGFAGGAIRLAIGAQPENVANPA